MHFNLSALYIDCNQRRKKERRGRVREREKIVGVRERGGRSKDLSLFLFLLNQCQQFTFLEGTQERTQCSTISSGSLVLQQ